MKTRIIPVLMTVMLTATAVQARPNDDDGDGQPERGRRPPTAAPQPQQEPQRQAQPQQQTQAQQPQPQPQPRERERPGPGAAPPRGWIPGDPNHPSAPRGNPYAGNQGSQRGAPPVPPAPPAPGAGGNGAQGSGQQAGPRAGRAGQQAGDRSPRGSGPQFSNQNPNWQADRLRAPNRAGPPNGNPPRNWRDSQGHDWRANRGWYDRYRVDHFRYNGGRYFARQRYSLGGYAWPRGYTSRLWLAGEWLPSVFFIDGRYDLNDYWSYDLYEPPLGCRWTRVGSDALLIDEVTGEVLDVVYDLFW